MRYHDDPRLRLRRLRRAAHCRLCRSAVVVLLVRRLLQARVIDGPVHRHVVVLVLLAAEVNGPALADLGQPVVHQLRLSGGRRDEDVVAGLVLFGAHLVLIGYLAYRSGYMPRILGVLLVVAGLGYVFDSVGFVLSESPLEVSTVTFVGEFLLCLWLLIRGRRMTVGTDDHAI